jgi:hypothetical protein
MQKTCTLLFSSSLLLSFSPPPSPSLFYFPKRNEREKEREDEGVDAFIGEGERPLPRQMRAASGGGDVRKGSKPPPPPSPLSEGITRDTFLPLLCSSLIHRKRNLRIMDR